VADGRAEPFRVCRICSGVMQDTDNDTETEETIVLDKQEARQAETKTGMPVVLGGGILLAGTLLTLVYAFFL